MAGFTRTHAQPPGQAWRISGENLNSGLSVAMNGISTWWPPRPTLGLIQRKKRPQNRIPARQKLQPVAGNDNHMAITPHGLLHAALPAPKNIRTAKISATL
jgi:hypothetical protein